MYQVLYCLSSNCWKWPSLLVLQFGLPCKTLFPQALELTQARFVRNRMLLPIGHRLHFLLSHLEVIVVEFCHCSSFQFVSVRKDRNFLRNFQEKGEKYVFLKFGSLGIFLYLCNIKLRVKAAAQHSSSKLGSAFTLHFTWRTRGMERCVFMNKQGCGSQLVSTSLLYGT